MWVAKGVTKRENEALCVFVLPLSHGVVMRDGECFSHTPTHTTGEKMPTPKINHLDLKSQLS